MKQIMLFLLILVLTGFSISTNQKQNSWEVKYYEVKKERDYYKQASEELLKNWKGCEEKKVELIKSIG
tara:strand:+ start:7310 stop:7513 length:204 start_codon:yes stop_codon:yes gene_type:complete